jgi:hypothetical protein
MSTYRKSPGCRLKAVTNPVQYVLSPVEVPLTSRASIATHAGPFPLVISISKPYGNYSVPVVVPIRRIVHNLDRFGEDLCVRRRHPSA